MKEFHTQIGERIRRLRIQHGLTQREVSKQAEIAYKYYQRIEGKNPPNLKVDTIEKFSKAFIFPLASSLIFNIRGGASMRRFVIKAILFVRIQIQILNNGIKKRTKFFRTILVTGLLQLTKCLNFLSTLGKNEEYIQEIPEGRFYIRKGTMDRYIIGELFTKKTYPVAIHEQAVVLDVGGNIGAFTVYAAQKASKGKVIVFEPEKSNYAQLKKNVSLNKLENVELAQLGVASRPGTFTLFLSKRNSAAHSTLDRMFTP